MRILFPALVACCALAAQAQAEWLDSPQAKEFRDRVIQLALLYGESNGIDLRFIPTRVR